MSTENRLLCPPHETSWFLSSICKYFKHFVGVPEMNFETLSLQKAFEEFEHILLSSFWKIALSILWENPTSTAPLQQPTTPFHLVLICFNANLVFPASDCFPLPHLLHVSLQFVSENMIVPFWSCFSSFVFVFEAIFQINDGGMAHPYIAITHWHFQVWFVCCCTTLWGFFAYLSRNSSGGRSGVSFRALT